ncbi:unnamed protein product [Pedinophyceae sp. YPF-701]|nr:unnamed protein product [Pedinophyceae sp. YPF-701]
MPASRGRRSGSKAAGPASKRRKAAEDPGDASLDSFLTKLAARLAGDDGAVAKDLGKEDLAVALDASLAALSDAKIKGAITADTDGCVSRLAELLGLQDHPKTEAGRKEKAPKAKKRPSKAAPASSVDDIADFATDIAGTLLDRSFQAAETSLAGSHEAGAGLAVACARFPPSSAAVDSLVDRSTGGALAKAKRADGVASAHSLLGMTAAAVAAPAAAVDAALGNAAVAAALREACAEATSIEDVTAVREAASRCVARTCLLLRWAAASGDPDRGQPYGLPDPSPPSTESSGAGALVAALSAHAECELVLAANGRGGCPGTVGLAKKLDAGLAAAGRLGGIAAQLLPALAASDDGALQPCGASADGKSASADALWLALYDATYAAGAEGLAGAPDAGQHGLVLYLRQVAVLRRAETLLSRVGRRGDARTAALRLGRGAPPQELRAWAAAQTQAPAVAALVAAGERGGAAAILRFLSKEASGDDLAVLLRLAQASEAAEGGRGEEGGGVEALADDVLFTVDGGGAAGQFGPAWRPSASGGESGEESDGTSSDGEGGSADADAALQRLLGRRKAGVDMAALDEGGSGDSSGSEESE